MPLDDLLLCTKNIENQMGIPPDKTEERQAPSYRITNMGRPQGGNMYAPFSSATLCMHANFQIG
jgi:hypothetical protein